MGEHEAHGFLFYGRPWEERNHGLFNYEVIEEVKDGRIGEDQEDDGGLFLGEADV